MSETSIVSGRLLEVAYICMLWTLALHDKSAWWMSLPTYELSCCVDSGFCVFRWIKGFLASMFFVPCRYYFRWFTGQSFPGVSFVVRRDWVGYRPLIWGRTPCLWHRRGVRWPASRFQQCWGCLFYFYGGVTTELMLYKTYGLRRVFIWYLRFMTEGQVNILLCHNVTYC